MANRDDELPSRKLAGLLRAEIEEGAKYPAGALLPSYRKLSTEHGVAINTAQNAVRILSAEGLVEIRGTSGAYVRDRTAEPESGPDVRAELVEIRDRLRRTMDELAATESAVTGLLERLPSEGPAAE